MMGVFSRWFGREDEDENEQGGEDLYGAREAQILQDVCDAIDVINANMGSLPRGVTLWMQWRPRPRLTLTLRGEVEREVLHGDGLRRMEFDR